MSSDVQWRSHYLFIILRAYRMLGLIRRVFSSSTDVYTKCCLYLSLVHSKLLYCSPVWRPQYLVDIRSLETVQRRASKFNSSNSAMDYRYRLISLEMLPLMMEYEIADIMFLIKSLKNPSSHFNLLDFITFNICHLIILCDLFICSFSFVAAGSLACRPSVQIYPIILTNCYLCNCYSCTEKL